MKALILNECGDNAVFKLEDVEKSSVKAGHVLIKISASSVNTVDTMIRLVSGEAMGKVVIDI